MTQNFEDGRLTMVCIASGEEICTENPQAERFKGKMRMSKQAIYVRMSKLTRKNVKLRCEKLDNLLLLQAPKVKMINRCQAWRM